MTLAPPVPLWLHCWRGLSGPGADRHEIPPGSVYYTLPDASSPTGTLLLCAACWAAESGTEQVSSKSLQLALAI